MRLVPTQYPAIHRALLIALKALTKARFILSLLLGSIKAYEFIFSPAITLAFNSDRRLRAVKWANYVFSLDRHFLLPPKFLSTQALRMISISCSPRPSLIASSKSRQVSQQNHSRALLCNFFSFSFIFLLSFRYTWLTKPNKCDRITLRSDLSVILFPKLHPRALDGFGGCSFFIPRDIS